MDQHVVAAEGDQFRPQDHGRSVLAADAPHHRRGVAAQRLFQRVVGCLIGEQVAAEMRAQHLVAGIAEEADARGVDLDVAPFDVNDPVRIERSIEHAEEFGREGEFVHRRHADTHTPQR